MITDDSEDMFPPQLERVLGHLSGVRKSLKGWTACCPAHDDRTPSLSIGLGKEGQVVLHCFAGCSFASIVQALGLQAADLFPVDPAASPRQKETTRHTLSLLDLAQAKKLPWKFLCNLGILEEARADCVFLTMPWMERLLPAIGSEPLLSPMMAPGGTKGQERQALAIDRQQPERQPVLCV